jgi:hypothetical protein
VGRGLGVNAGLAVGEGLGVRVAVAVGVGVGDGVVPAWTSKARQTNGTIHPKLIVSPPLASASAWRSEPGPLSFVLETVMMFAWADIAPAQITARQIRGIRLKKVD